MESRTPSPRNLYLAGAVAGVLLLGAAVYFASVTPAESQVMPASAKVPASASASVSASAKAVVAPRAPAAANVAPTVPVEPQHLRSKEQAASALMALPELQAWSAIVEKNSGGKSHGALIEYDPAPRKLNGKNYWQFSFVENSAEAAQRWESFLVSSSDEEILVEDASTDEVISLARWRREKHPAKRTSIDN